MRQFSYLSADGTFDYERYREVQTAANKMKLANQWVREPAIAYLCEYIRKSLGAPKFGLCHGTRRGAEQKWFADRLGCEVLGTEISDTATQFPNTIQWDFHEVKAEWIGAVDFIYSNSWDHSYDPVKLFKAWASCLKPGGLLFLEHTSASITVNETDPLGMTVEEMVALINDLGKAGGYEVVEVLRDGPITGLPGMEAPATHVVVKRTAPVRHPLAICTLMANERPYIEEWLAFHAQQGVTLFLVYVDKSRVDLADDGTEALLRELAPRFNVEVELWTNPGQPRQVAAFSAGLELLRGRADWVACIDCDEFLFNPNPYQNLVGWLNALPPEVTGVGVQQRVFGSSGRLTMPRIPVTEAFTMRASADYPEHRWYKSIVRPGACKRFYISHHALLDEGEYVLGDGAPFDVSRPGCATRIAQTGLRLHHYMLKSRQEFETKKARGAPSDGMGDKPRFDDSYFTSRDANANKVQDRTLADRSAAAQR